MINVPFGHKTIRNTILTFGRMFSNIKIQRHNTDGSLGQTIGVPIVYGAREKILVRLREDPTLENQVMVTLPRMAFEITGITYDTTRMINRNNKINCHKIDGSASAVFTPVPYNIGINLYLLTKGSEDAFDVIEQVLPSFAPEYTATIKTIPTMNITQDVAFVMNGVTQEDDYEGDFSTRRLVTTTFSFDAKISLYGPSTGGSVITRTDTSVLGQSETDIMAVHTSTGDPITGTITSDFWT